MVVALVVRAVAGVMGAVDAVSAAVGVMADDEGKFTPSVIQN